MAALIPLAEKWQWVLKFGRDYQRMYPGWNIFEFGILKIIHVPPPGEILRKHQYKGFMVHLRIWLPIERF